jgi:hypothetical protein
MRYVLDSSAAPIISQGNEEHPMTIIAANDKNLLEAVKKLPPK